MPERQFERWSLASALRRGVVQLFPTRRTRTALWCVVGLGVLTTYMELVAAQLFSTLITRIDEQTSLQTALTLGGFLVTFAAIRGISYFQSVYRLTVFEKGLREIQSESRAAEAWRWPMAIGLVGMMGQIARLAVVSVTVAMTSWQYGLLLLICSLIAMLIVNRTGRRQYDIHHEFVEAKRAGSPPSAAERIGTRIKAGERAGLVAVGPVLVYVAALGVGAADGRITAQSALVLFIAGRMAANMYGSLSSESMRYIRAQVNVEEYDGPAAVSAATFGDEEDDDGIDQEQDVDNVDPSGDLGASGIEPDSDLLTGGYLWEPPAQAFARLIDDGRLIGSPAMLGQAGRERGFGPDRELREKAPMPMPESVVAYAPNSVWVLSTSALPVIGSGESVCVQMLVDLFSRAIVRWRIFEGEPTDVARFVEETCRRDLIAVEDVDVHVPAGTLGRYPNLNDLLRSLGVVRTLIWTTDEIVPADPKPDQPARPVFPISFATAAEAEAWVSDFVDWYNHGFYLADIGYLHPADVRAGSAEVITSQRQRTLDSFSDTERAVLAGGYPEILAPPRAARIRREKTTTLARSVTPAEVAMDEEGGEF